MVKKIAVLFVLVGIIPFAVNFRDEKLLPEGKKILISPPPPTRPIVENAYFALLGFKAPGGEDIVDAGTKAHLAYFNSQTNIPPALSFSLEETIGTPPEMAPPGEIPQCRHREGGCLARLFAEGAKIKAIEEKNGILKTRYASLNRFPFYQNLTKPAPWAPRIELLGPIFSGHALALGDAAVAFESGRRNEAVLTLVQDMKLWRKLLAGAESLANKETALQTLRQSLELAADMCKVATNGECGALVADDVLMPLTPRERSLDRVWDREFESLAWSLYNDRLPMGLYSENGIPSWQRYFLKTNATLNDVYAVFRIMKQIAPLPRQEYADGRSVFREAIEKARTWRPDMLYNPVGKSFVATAFYDGVLDGWNERMNDLDDEAASLKGSLP